MAPFGLLLRSATKEILSEFSLKLVELNKVLTEPNPPSSLNVKSKIPYTSPTPMIFGILRTIQPCVGFIYCFLLTLSVLGCNAILVTFIPNDPKNSTYPKNLSGLCAKELYKGYLNYNCALYIL